MPEVNSAELKPNEPIEAEAPDSMLVITIDPNKPLPVGTHIFQLEVEDDAGNRSQPQQVSIVIFDDQAPTAILKAPPQVSFGKPFTLSGEESFDAGGGRIQRFIWTLVQ